MRILILSNYPWKNDNSFGNTYSNIFGYLPDTEIAHIYLFDGQPDYVPNVTHYYQILERDVVKSVFRKTRVHGRRFSGENKSGEHGVSKTNYTNSSTYSKLLSFGKLHHWRFLFIARELAWKFGKIDYHGLMDFVDDFNPDLFFLPFSNVFYTNRLASYIKSHADIPMVMEMAMDHFTLNRVSYNPFFWIDRFSKRRMIKKLSRQSEMMFVISKKLKKELENQLGIPCRILYKMPDLDRALEPYLQSNGIIQFIFTGNIYCNRWKSLAMLVAELKKKKFGRLDVYTSSPITPKIEKALNVEGYSAIHPPVSPLEVIKLQNNADVLVHAEGFDKYNKSLVRCAISTKIMDYLSAGRCILAIGPSDISSIELLAENDVALIANDEKSLSSIIAQMQSNPNTILEYATKGRNYTNSFLDSGRMRLDFYNELQRIIDNYNSSK